MKKNFLFIIIAVILILKPNYTLSIEPDIFIQSTVNRAANTLGGNLTKEERIKELKNIAKETVDIEGISLYSLGAYRKKISDDQLIKYKKLFKSYFLKSFSSRLVDYTDPKINVISQKKINDKYTIVNSILEATSKRPQVKIDWRIYTKNPDKPLIRDLIVEGLSLARTQKEEFASVIESNNGDVKKLFITLQEFINK